MEKSTPKTAAVLGANGQDGTWLIRNLKKRGYKVVGAGIEPEPRLAQDAGYSYQTVDLTDPRFSSSFLKSVKPELVFHVAAVHASAAGSSKLDYELKWQLMLAVNTASVHTILEYFRTENQQGRLLYLSSGKMFGPDYPEIVNENSPKKRKCLYTITKGATEDLIFYYRERHGSHSSIIYPFPHESDLRPSDFFIAKLASTLADALAGRAGKTTFFGLDFYGDWGLAEEYMDICIDVAERAIGQDFLLAAGKSWYARDLARAVFEKCGLRYEDYIETGVSSSSDYFLVSTQKLADAIGRVPQQSVLDLIIAMARSAQTQSETGAV